MAASKTKRNMTRRIYAEDMKKRPSTKRPAKRNAGHLFRVYARTRADVPNSAHNWFEVHQGIHRSKTSALAEAKKTYRRDYDPRYLKDLEWQVTTGSRPNPKRAKKAAPKKKNFFGLFRRSDFSRLAQELKASPKNRSLMRELIRAGEEKNKSKAQIAAAFRRAKVSTFDTREALRGYEKKKLKKFKAKKAKKAAKKSSKPQRTQSTQSKHSAAVEKQLAGLGPKARAQAEAQLRQNGRKIAGNPKKRNAKVSPRLKRIPGSATYEGGYYDSVKKKYLPMPGWFETGSKGKGSKAFRRKYPKLAKMLDAGLTQDQIISTPLDLRKGRLPNPLPRKNRTVMKVKKMVVVNKGKKKTRATGRRKGRGRKNQADWLLMPAGAEIVRRVASGGRKRRNSAQASPAAKAKRKEFIGRPSQRTLSQLAANGTPKNLSGCGPLWMLKIKGHPQDESYSKNDAPMVSMRPDGSQLFITGGKRRFAPGYAGRLEKIGYEARKTHLGDNRTMSYHHTFKHPPKCWTDREGFLHIARGRYVVTENGIEDT